MTQPYLFQDERREWVAEQMRLLDLKPGDPNYDGARQAAERGWTAAAIRPLIWPAGAPG